MALFGVLLAVASAFLASGTDVLRKYNSTSFDPVTAAWALHGTTFLLAFPVVLMVNGIGLSAIEALQIFAHPFPVSAAFWQAFGVTVLLNVPATLLWMRALGRGDLSVAAPLSTLTPAFILLTAPFITGEVPSLLGIVGVLVLTLGAFLLTSSKGSGMRVGAVFLGLLRNPLHRDVLIVAFLYALVAPWEKQTVLEGGSLWYTLLIHGFLALILFPFLFQKRRLQNMVRAREWPALLPFGVFNLLRSYAQFTALGLLPTFYVIGLKRSGMLLNVLWGRLFFKEQQTGRRFAAAGVMLVGALLTLWASLS